MAPRPARGSGLPARWSERARLIGCRGRGTTMKALCSTASLTAAGRHTGRTAAAAIAGGSMARWWARGEPTRCPWGTAPPTVDLCSTGSHTARVPPITIMARIGTRGSGRMGCGTATARPTVVHGPGWYSRDTSQAGRRKMGHSTPPLRISSSGGLVRQSHQKSRRSCKRTVGGSLTACPMHDGRKGGDAAVCVCVPLRV
mmetsp:Transcript_13600/g.39239  ORF Transcript_13600/g.39239 Transcript_13600/m.39239 type:complete len:200 (-) Transcript_13600:73-672(-)